MNEPSGRDSRLRRALLIYVFAAWMMTADRASAQTPAPISLDSIQRIDVPAERPDSWPDRDVRWIPLTRADFETMLQRAVPARPGPAGNTFEKVRYTAAFAGDSLIQGQLQTQWKAADARPRFVSLGTPNLAIDDVSWTDRRAVWGADLDGRHWVWLDRREGALHGSWSRRGRQLSSGVAFDLHFLPAAVTELQLDVPRDLALKSDQGDVESIPHPSDDSRKLWTVHLGNLAQCRLVIAPAAKPDPGAPVVLYQQETAITVGSDDPLVNVTFQAEVLQGEIDRLTVTMPRAVEVASVSYGDQTSLAWEPIAAEGPAGKLLVKLPERTRGRLRPLRLECSLRRASGESLTVPQIALESGTWLDGRIDVTVARPWELRSFRATGCRQAGPPTPMAESESIVFQQLSTRSQLFLNIERPTMERIAHALNVLTETDTVWTLTTEIAFGSRNGSVFSASCRIPDDWNVMSVVQLGGGRETEQLPGWEVQSHPESGQMLLLEFSEGLTPGRINAVRIIAQRSRAVGKPPSGWPLILPTDCETSEVVLFGRAAVLADVMPPQSDALENFDQAAASAVWNTLPTWTRVGQEPEFKLLHVTNLDTLRAPLTGGNQRALDVEVDIRVHLAEGGMSEEVVLQLHGAPPGTVVEMELPSRLAEGTWSVNEIPDSSVSLIRTPLTTGERADNSENQRYSFTIPAGAPEVVTLMGRINSPRLAEFPISLVFVPAARTFQGQVAVSADHPGRYRLREESAGAAKPGNWIAAEPERWSYRTPDRNWTVIAEPGAPGATTPVEAVLRSLVGSQSNGRDMHELSIRVAAGVDLRNSWLELPDSAELVAVLQNGIVLPVSAEGNRITPSGWSLAAGGDLQVIYRTPVAAKFCRTQHSLLIPQSSWSWTSLTWQICLPPGSEVHSLPGELARDPYVGSPPWQERLFGILGRRDEFSHIGGRTANASSDASDTQLNETGSMRLHFPPAWPVVSGNLMEAPSAAKFVVWDRADLRLLSWVALLAAWPLGWWMRRRVAYRRAWLAGLLAAVGCLAVFGPEGWSIVIGSGFAGLVVGILLPIERWRLVQTQSGPTADASVSTEVFRRAITSAAIIVLAGYGLGMLSAQDSVPESAQPVAKQTPFRVLVPVEHDGAPSQGVPLVYVTPEFLDALKAANAAAELEPSQLVSEAHASITRDANGKLLIRARYAITVIGATPPTEIRIPLEPDWQAGLESCFLNGASQAATAEPNGRFLTVPLEPLPQADAPENSTQLRSWNFDALLQFRLSAELASAGQELHSELFPVLNRRLTWQSSIPWQHVEIPQAYGQTRVSLDRRTLEASLGATPAVTVFNRAIEPKPGPKGATELEILQLLTLRPAVSQVAFRAQCRVLEGAVNSLEVTLPPGGVLREVRGNKILETLQQTSENGRSGAVVEFSESLQGEFVVEGDYLIPRVSPDARVEFPRLEISCGESTTSARELVALASPGLDFQTQSINLDDPAILPVQVEQFVARWGDSIPTLRPQAAFQVQPKGQPAFRLQALPAEQQLVSWNEDVFVSRQRIDWVLSAEIAAGRIPALTYAVLLDRRLNLESVSVQNNGAEQLLRWSKTPLIGSSQNRLTLFLNREVAGTAQLRIRGNLRVRPASPVALPSVRFETSQSVAGTLTIAHEAGHRLTILRRDGATDASGSATAATNEEAEADGSRRMNISEGESGLTFRLDPLAGKCAQQSCWLVAPGESTVRVLGVVVLTPMEGTREVRLPLPDWLQDARLESIQRGQAPVELSEAEQRFLQWSCDPDQNDTLQLAWEAELPMPAGDVLQLPLPTALKAVDPAAWAAIDTSSQWTIAGQSPNLASPLPDAFRALLPADFMIPGEDGLVRLDGNVLSVQRRDARSADGRSSVRMVEHTLRNSGEGGWIGQTDIFPSPSGDAISVAIPANLEPQALLLDDRLVALDQFDANERRWHVRDAGRHRRMTVRWRQSAAGPRRFGISEARALLPTCVQERQPDTYVRLLSTASRWMAIPQSGVAVAPWELAVARVETELNRQILLPEAGKSRDAGVRQLWRDYRRAADLFSQRALENKVSPEHRQRWESITRSMQAVSSDPGMETADALAGDTVITDIEADDRIYRLPADQQAQFASWIIREDLGRWIAGSLAFLIATALLWRVVGWLSLPWWNNRPAAAWLVCGIVWSLCFSPPILGWAMIAWAIWIMWRKPAARPALAAQG